MMLYRWPQLAELQPEPRKEAQQGRRHHCADVAHALRRRHAYDCGKQTESSRESLWRPTFVCFSPTAVGASDLRQRFSRKAEARDLTQTMSRGTESPQHIDV